MSVPPLPLTTNSVLWLNQSPNYISHPHSNPSVHVIPSAWSLCPHRRGWSFLALYFHGIYFWQYDGVLTISILKPDSLHSKIPVLNKCLWLSFLSYKLGIIIVPSLVLLKMLIHVQCMCPACNKQTWSICCRLCYGNQDDSDRTISPRKLKGLLGNTVVNPELMAIPEQQYHAYRKPGFSCRLLYFSQLKSFLVFLKFSTSWNFTGA